MAKQVVDASVATTLSVLDQLTRAAHIVRATSDLAAPSLVRAELVNAWSTRVRDGGLSRSDFRVAIARTRYAMTTDSDDPVAVRAGVLAAERGHPLYVPIRIALADRFDTVLVITDERLIRIASAPVPAGRLTSLATIAEPS